MNFFMHTNGKLLLTGEYFVLDGAVALALPTKYGQSLSVEPLEDSPKKELHWQSYDENNNLWFEIKFHLPSLKFKTQAKGEEAEKVATRLQEILQEAQKLNPKFLKKIEVPGLLVKTKLDFPRDWGLGSSATLVRMVAEWAKVDAFELLENTFGGSGYDLVTATAEGPMLFQKFNKKNRWDEARFDPEFKEHLYFVHLNQKQDSREAMVYFKITPEDERAQPLQRITQITHDVNAYTKDLGTFEELIKEHEELVQSIIQQDRAKDLYFKDYWGEVKSLGAWGGDFVLVTSNKTAEETKQYFAEKGYETFLSYEEMIK